MLMKLVSVPLIILVVPVEKYKRNIYAMFGSPIVIKVAVVDTVI